MNYNDWVKAFRERTPLQLGGIISALNTLEKDVDIKREFSGLGLFGGFSIRSATKEALKGKNDRHTKTIAQRAYTMTIARIVEEYPQVNPAVITCPATFGKVFDWIRETKTVDSILDTVGAIIDAVIDDTHLYYPGLRSKSIKEADLYPDANEAECSILYGDAYYSLEDSVVELLTAFLNNRELTCINDGGNSAISTTPYFWDCECGSRFIHPKIQQECFDCNTAASGQPDSRVSEVICTTLKGEI